MGGLLIGSTLFLITINYMADNIEDFESRPLPSSQADVSIIPQSNN